MKRNGPMLTLLAGIAVAAVLFLLNNQATQTSNAAQSAPAGVAGASAPVLSPRVSASGPSQTPPVGPTATVDKQPLVQQAAPDGTWAGEVKAGTLAISIKDGKAVAYLCDGRKTEAWLKGTAREGRLDLTGKNGAALTGTVDKQRVEGRVTIGGRTAKMDIDAVRKPSGLYRATANVRGANVVGGWIVLKDGSQVGLATVDGRLTRPSELDVATGRATVDGSAVTAVPADPTR